jgi:hypothetical protein
VTLNLVDGAERGAADLPDARRAQNNLGSIQSLGCCQETRRLTSNRGDFGFLQPENLKYQTIPATIPHPRPNSPERRAQSRVSKK